MEEQIIMKETYNLVKPEDGIFMAYAKGLAAGIVVFVGCVVLLAFCLVIVPLIAIALLLMCAIVLAFCLVIYPLGAIIFPIICIVYPYCVTITTED